MHHVHAFASATPHQSTNVSQAMNRPAAVIAVVTMAAPPWAR